MLAIAAFASYLAEFFLLTTIAVFGIFAVYAALKLYKQRMYNIADGIILSNLVLITVLKWYTSVPLTVITSQTTIDFIIFLQLLLMYIPLVGLGGYGVYH